MTAMTAIMFGITAAADTHSMPLQSRYPLW